MTPTYLATSADVKENNVKGRFYSPMQDWLFRYTHSEDVGVSWFAKDMKAAAECWEWSLGVMKEALEKEKGEERMMFAEPTPSRRCWHTSANYQLTFALDSIISFVTLYFSVYKTLLFHL